VRDGGGDDRTGPRRSADLVFLDIRLPDMDGFDVIDALSSHKELIMPRIVFTTAYDQYASRAFEVRAVDYLLKPFTPERLRSALGRIRQHAMAAPPMERGTASRAGTRRALSSIEGARSVSAGFGNPLDCGRGETMCASPRRMRRTCCARRWPPGGAAGPRVFLRVHRSSIVNLQYVKEVRMDAEGEAAVMLVNGQKVSMSRSYRSRFSGLVHQ